MSLTLGGTLTRGTAWRREPALQLAQRRAPRFQLMVRLRWPLSMVRHPGAELTVLRHRSRRRRRRRARLGSRPACRWAPGTEGRLRRWARARVRAALAAYFQRP